MTYKTSQTAAFGAKLQNTKGEGSVRLNLVEYFMQFGILHSDLPTVEYTYYRVYWEYTRQERNTNQRNHGKQLSSKKQRSTKYPSSPMTLISPSPISPGRPGADNATFSTRLDKYQRSIDTSGTLILIIDPTCRTFHYKDAKFLFSLVQLRKLSYVGYYTVVRFHRSRSCRTFSFSAITRPFSVQLLSTVADWSLDLEEAMPYRQVE